MSKTKGFRPAIRDRLKKYGIIYEVLLKYKMVTKTQKLIYDEFIRPFVKASEKTKCLNFLFKRYEGEDEWEVFHRMIPWHVLDQDETSDFVNLEEWIKIRENECK